MESQYSSHASDVQSEREKAEAGDIAGSLRYLLADYEAYGDAAIRTLAVEDHISAAKKMLEAGRAYHREWCARVFAPYLPAKSNADYEQSLTAFVAATELYLWKLMRRDLNHSAEQTFETFLTLVNALVANQETS